MHIARPHLFSLSRFLLFALAALAPALFVGPASTAQESPQILPLSQVRAGMQGYAYTIFAGDEVEKFDLEVIGVLDHFLAPNQSTIFPPSNAPKIHPTA